MQAVHSDENDIHEIAMNSYQVRKINEMRNAIGFQPLNIFVSVKTEVSYRNLHIDIESALCSGNLSEQCCLTL